MSVDRRYHLYIPIFRYWVLSTFILIIITVAAYFGTNQLTIASELPQQTVTMIAGAIIGCALACSLLLGYRKLRRLHKLENELSLLASQHGISRPDKHQDVEASAQLLKDLRLSMEAKDSRIRDLAKQIDRQNKQLAVQAQKETLHQQALDQARAERNSNLANLQHEIRTPLSGIVAAVEMLEQTAVQGITSLLRLKFSGLPPDHLKQIMESRQEIREVHTILDEILKPSTNLMESTLDQLIQSLQGMNDGNIKLHIAPFPLTNIISTTIRSYQDMANKKGLLFNHQLINETGIADKQLCYKGDLARILQVLSNLLSNAVRFTQTGGVDLKIEVTKHAQPNKHCLHFIVSDTGCGISETEVAKIFNLFHIGEEQTRKENSGLGTGLAIAKRVADHLGGKVYLQKSTIGTGSTFVFELELTVTSMLDSALPKISHEPHQISLLYVEDSKTNRSVFKQYCDRSNINLQLAVDGEDGWDKYQSFKFDALVVDCWMPHKNGFELVTDIRAHEKSHDLPRIPIFALTADPTNKNQQRCLDAGYDEFLTKPYKMDTFNFIVERTDALVQKQVYPESEREM